MAVEQDMLYEQYRDVNATFLAAYYLFGEPGEVVAIDQAIEQLNGIMDLLEQRKQELAAG